MFAILGATGKAGGAAARVLRQHGLPVRAIVRDRARAQELAALGCEIAVADFRDSAALTAAVDGAEAVQAIIPVSPQGPDPLAAMRATSEAICAALAAARPNRVVAISDFGAERGAGTGITLAFHHLEARLRESAPQAIFLRSAEHMQNWSRLFKAAAETGVLPSLHHPVTKIFPMVSAQDVGMVAADLMASPTAPPGIVYVEGPRRYTPQDVADTLSRVFGKTIVAGELPRADWIAALVRGGLSAGYAALVAELYDAHNAGLIEVEPGVSDVRRGATEFADLPIFQPMALSALKGSPAR
jgi:NAD(P)H dehydrogenase (quinone)